MAFNGSGVYTAPVNSFNPAVTNTTISSTAWNAVLDDLEANGLSYAVVKDGQQTCTASIPFVQGIGVGTANAFAVSSAGTVTSTSTSSQIIKGPVNIAAATAGQIVFPATQNASSNANTLDDYVEATHTTDITGYSADPSVAVKITKIGNRVFLTFPGCTGTSDAATKTFNTAIVAAYRPATTHRCPAYVSDNGGSAVWGNATFNTDGTVSFFLPPGDAAWTASGTAAILPFSTNWNV